MIVEFIKTGEKREVSASYGTRLIEQGVAVAAKPALPAAEKSAARTADASATKKGGKAGDA